MAQQPDRKPVDWEAMRPHYEAGIIPYKVLGKTFGCSDAAIVKHAAKNGWKRDLKARIQLAADAKVAAKAVNKPVSASAKALTEAVVEGNATLQANIRLEHRVDIKRIRAVTMGMLGELEAQAAILKPTKGKRKLNLQQRTLVAKNLTEAMRVQIGLERQAFGIDDRDAPPPEEVGFHERLLNARQRAASR